MNSNKKVFIIIESPMQLIGALEAIFLLNLNDYLLVVRYSNERNNRQLKKIIQDFGVDLRYIKYIHLNSEANLKNIYKMIKFIVWIARNKRNIHKVYLGDYNSRLLMILRKYILNKNQIYYLDDGVASLNIQKKFTKNYFYHFFTMYNLKPFKGQYVRQHKFLYLKDNIKIDLLEKENIVLLLGNKFYEEGLVTKEYFFKSLEQLLTYYPNQNIRYVAHRDEKIEKLKYLEKYYGFDVVQYDYPIELYGFYEKKLPSDIVSFLSTALLTMKIIYEDVNVTSYRIDLSKLLNRKEGFKNIYKVYEDYLDVKEL